MADRLAHFFSWLFQPLLMPLAGTLIFLNLPYYAFTLMPVKLKWVVIFCNLLFTVVLPAGFILLMRRFKLIRSISLDDRSDRPVPVFLTGIFYAFNLYYLFRLYGYLPDLYYYFLMASIFSVISTLAISAWWKISMHMTGIGGLCGSVFLASMVWDLDLRYLLAAAFVAAGITGSARLQLKVHTPAQVGAGFLAGFLPQVALIMLT
jgi:hypothetical protein